MIQPYNAVVHEELPRIWWSDDGRYRRVMYKACLLLMVEYVLHPASASNGLRMLDGRKTTFNIHKGLVWYEYDCS